MSQPYDSPVSNAIELAGLDAATMLTELALYANDELWQNIGNRLKSDLTKKHWQMLSEVRHLLKHDTV